MTLKSSKGEKSVQAILSPLGVKSSQSLESFPLHPMQALLDRPPLDLLDLSYLSHSQWVYHDVVCTHYRLQLFKVQPSLLLLEEKLNT